jgi:hypothetical protein
MTINAATSGNVVLNVQTKAAPYVDTVANLAAALDGTATHTGGLTVSDVTAVSAADLNMINNFQASGATTAIATSNITGSSLEIATAIGSGITFRPNVTLSITGADPATIAELKTINEDTTGAVVLNAVTNSAAYNDTAANLAAAFLGITTSTGDLTIAGTTAANLAELMTINTATSGNVVLNQETNAAALTGTAADLISAFTGITSHTGGLTVTDTGPVSVADLNEINTFTSGTTTASATSLITGAATDILAAIGAVALASDVTLTITGVDEVTINDLQTMNAATSGAVVLNAATNAAAFTDTAANLISAFTGITSHTGGLTVSNTGGVSAANLNTILNDGDFVTIIGENGDDLSGLVGVDDIKINNNASLTVTIGQNSSISVATGENTVTLSDAGIATAMDTVEKYVLADGVNTFSTSAVGTTVTGGVDADTFVINDNGDEIDIIKNFTASQGDLVMLDAFISGGIYNNGTHVVDTTSGEISLNDVNNQLVYYSVQDVNAATVDELSLFGAGKEFSAEGDEEVQFLIAVGETSGVDGVHLYLVTDGVQNNDMSVTQIVTLENTSLADILSANLDVV